MYKEIVKCTEVRNYYGSGKKAHISDLVYTIISTILFDLKRKAGLTSIMLSREKEIVPTGSETGGIEGGLSSS